MIVCPEMQVIRSTLNFDKPPEVSRVTVDDSSRRTVRRTLNDLSCLYFSPEVTAKFTIRARKHFVTLVEIGLHLIECNPGHIFFSMPFSLIHFIWMPRSGRAGSQRVKLNKTQEFK